MYVRATNPETRCEICCICGWALRSLITARPCRTQCVCACAHVFTLSADGGICAECRPAESLLRQRQAGRCRERAAADAAAAAAAGGSLWVQLWPWRRRRLWRTSVRQSSAGGEQGEDAERERVIERAPNDEDRPQPTQEMGPRGQDHTYPAGTREWHSGSLIRSVGQPGSRTFWCGLKCPLMLLCFCEGLSWVKLSFCFKKKSPTFRKVTIYYNNDHKGSKWIF